MIKAKFHLLFYFFFLILYFISCTSGPPCGPLSLSADFSGLVTGRITTPEEYALVDSLGASWLLATFRWNLLEKTEGQWDFSTYDKFADAANADGKKIIGIMGYDVPWIHDNPNSPRYIPPDKLHYFLNYVRETALHYRGKVGAWCIWNEPNFGDNWVGDRNDFFELTRQAAAVIREADPDVIILGGGFNRGIIGMPVKYIRGLFESGAMNQADAVAFHPYELNPDRTAKLYRAFRSIVADYGFAERIWITEIGYPTGGWYPTAVSEKRFPEYIVKTYVNLAINGAKRVFIYQLFDPAEREKRNSEDYFGLVRSKSDYTSKGAEAFRLCAVYLSGTEYYPDLPKRKGLPKSLKAFYFSGSVNSEEGGTLVLWKKGIPVKLNFQYGGTYFIHNPVSGETFEHTGESPVTIGKTPVIITWNGEDQIIVKR